jgi:AcrR family transcriptional regulator
LSTSDAQGERSARKQRQLLDAAERVYHRHGDLGLTVRRLAAEAEATSQTIYTYFGSRDAVIDGMYDRITGDVSSLLETMESQLVTGGDDLDTAVSALTRAAATYRRYCVRHPARFDMLSGGHGPQGWDPLPMADLRRRLVAMIEQSVPGHDGDRCSRLLLASWHGVIKAQLDQLLPSSGEGDTSSEASQGGGNGSADDSTTVDSADDLLRCLVENLLAARPLSGAASNGS